MPLAGFMFVPPSLGSTPAFGGLEAGEIAALPTRGPTQLGRGPDSPSVTTVKGV